MRILGIDYGDARVGLALSDPLGWTAQALPALPGYRTEELLNGLEQVIRENGVERIVLGYPKNMNGTRGPRAELTEAFTEKLRQRFSLPVELWDERLTTVSAARVMNETNVRGQKRKQQIDSLSAVLILENYLNAQGR